MIRSEELRKYIFMNYKEVLQYFKENDIKTKGLKEITHKDLRTAVLLMNEKHPLCRWQSEKFRKRYYYLQYEGVIWLRDVYFNNYKTKLIDKDVQWFEERILWYQNTLAQKNIKYPKMNFQLTPMSKKELAKFFKRDVSTIKKAITEMEQQTNFKNRNYHNGILYIDENQILWLLKNKFKRTYIKFLETYKMELTEIYKANGGFYDNYFGRN